MGTFVISHELVSFLLNLWPPLNLDRLPLVAAASPQHAGRPLSADAVLRQRPARRPGPPVRCQRAVRVLGAVQPPGSLSHHHVCHRHAEVSLAPGQPYYAACLVAPRLSARVKINSVQSG